MIGTLDYVHFIKGEFLNTNTERGHVAIVDKLNMMKRVIMEFVMIVIEIGNVYNAKKV